MITGASRAPKKGDGNRSSSRAGALIHSGCRANSGASTGATIGLVDGNCSQGFGTRSFTAHSSDGERLPAIATGSPQTHAGAGLAV